MRLPLLLNGPLLVTEAFCESSVDHPATGPQVDEIGAGPAFPVDELRSRLAEIKGHPATHPAESDAAAAIAVRSLLDLRRREASEPTLWHYCAIVVSPEYVSWRWGGEGKSVPRNRYLGRWERNAIGRLWWLAELTRDTTRTNPYEMTVKTGSNQEFSLWCIDSFLSASPAILSQLVSAVFDRAVPLTSDQIREIFKKVTALRATRALDLLPPKVLQSLVEDVAGEITSPNPEGVEVSGIG
jgi:Family of unknown function (DUF6339)